VRIAVCQMAETARLGDLQRDTIIRLRDLYLRNVGILARRRKQLTAALQVPATLHDCWSACAARFTRR
jgi:hypothetical protein